MTIAAEFFHHTDLMVALGFGPLQSSLHIPLVGLFPSLSPCRNWWAIMLKERLVCTYIWFDGQGLFKFELAWCTGLLRKLLRKFGFTLTSNVC